MSGSQAAARPAIIVISSQVARGTVGNRAIVFALEAFGLPVWAVPTVILPWHPGHGPATRIVPDREAFAAFLEDLERAPWLGEVGAVLSGYLGDAGQAEAIASLVGAVRARNPGALYLCDPVIGDRAGLYVPPATAEAIRDRLMPLADIATPNRFELEWLSGSALPGNADIIRAARSASPETMLVTSAHAGAPGRIGNLLVTGEGCLLAEHAVLDNPPNGTGDITAALFLARTLRGDPPSAALRETASAVYGAVLHAHTRGLDELAPESDPQGLVRPAAEISVTDIDDEGNAVRRRTVAGVDGCMGGWVAVVRRGDDAIECAVHPTFAALVASLPDDSVIAVDMPIGLPELTGSGGRGPESLVRPLLGPRQSSVFSIPSRDAVYAESAPFSDLDSWYAAHRRASEVARQTSHPPRGVSIQAFALFPKIREIDAVLIENPALRTRIIESHPELAFWRLNGEAPMCLPKKVKGKINPPGMGERRELLAGLGVPRRFLAGGPPRGAAEDDFLDATAMLLVAERRAQGTAVSFPSPPGEDRHGIPIAIWC